MDPNIEDYIDQRLMVFDDDLDLNDWFEIFAGATMGGLGIFYLFNPIEAFDSNVISFFVCVHRIRWPHLGHERPQGHGSQGHASVRSSA